MRAALATLAVRASVPQDEELGLLPFAIGDLAGFKVVVMMMMMGRVGGGGASHDSGRRAARSCRQRGQTGGTTAAPAAPAGRRAPDAAKGTASPARGTAAGGLDARLLIAVVPGGPSQLDDHANFAREMFNEIGGITDIHVSMSEPLRIGGQPGFRPWRRRRTRAPAPT